MTQQTGPAIDAMYTQPKEHWHADDYIAFAQSHLEAVDDLTNNLGEAPSIRLQEYTQARIDLELRIAAVQAHLAIAKSLDDLTGPLVAFLEQVTH